MLPRELGGLQFAQHQRKAEVLTDLGQEPAQHILDKLPQVKVAALAVRTPWKASSSDDNTLREGITLGQANNHTVFISLHLSLERSDFFSFLVP